MPTATPTSSSTSVAVDTGFIISAQTGPIVNGTQNWYGAGVTTSWTPNPGQAGQAGDTAAGGTVSSNFAPIDGTSCVPTVEPAATTSTYAVHSFVGIYYNGTEYALPQAIGLENPTEPTASGHPNDNYEVETAQCSYNVHTHDYTGIVHIEDVNYPQSTSSTSPLPYAPSLQTLLDIWGVQLTSSGMTVPGGTALNGPVAIYYGTQSADKGPHGGFLTNAYVRAASASAVPLAFHDTIWIVIGDLPTPPNGIKGLPEVEWRIQY